MNDTERYDFDVVVIGAGGAGLRAAIEAREMGARTALVCKSLLGKAHTVMAEGGIAAALASVWPEDNWEVHFRDTMRGGKMLNNWRMAQIHALESPDRVLELEEWGALFDRTPDGRILQRDFGGHRYARLAHVGDRTGLEMIRALQHRAVSIGIDVFMECKIVRLLQDGAGAVNGAVGFWRESGRFVTFGAKAVVLATGGLGKAWKFTTNSWECTGDGMALALWAGADLIDMEAIQFHPTGMVWPPSARGLLVTEGVRGDGGVLKNRDGERFMFNYITPFFAAETAESIEEGDQWYTNKKDFRRPPELLPRDEVARAINSEVKADRGSPHGGVFLDIASRRTPEEIRRLLPSMYHQFNELYRDFKAGNTTTKANPALLPETLWGAETGFDFVAENSTVRVTAYRNALDNLITNVTLSSSPTAIVRQRANAAAALSRGVEAEFRQRLRDLTGELQYLYVESRSVSISSKTRVRCIARDAGEGARATPVRDSTLAFSASITRESSPPEAICRSE